jgi:hypothetical protein
MQYEVQDLEQNISGHEITIRVMNPVNPKEGHPLAQIGCSTCYQTTELNTKGEYLTVDDLKLISMECNLHAEGFDQLDWEAGELDNLDKLASHAHEDDDDEID